MYSIAFEPHAAREYRRIRGVDKARIDEGLTQLQRDPYGARNVSILKGPFEGSLRLRVGEWRIVFRVEGDSVVIEAVGRRKDVYKG